MGAGFIIHIAPVFLGSGIQLFNGIDKNRFTIEINVVNTSEWTRRV